MTESGNSQLLIDYKKALEEAYRLGEEVKEVYGIVPPKIYTDSYTPHQHSQGIAIVSLTVQG